MYLEELTEDLLGHALLGAGRWLRTNKSAWLQSALRAATDLKQVGATVGARQVQELTLEIKPQIPNLIVAIAAEANDRLEADPINISREELRTRAAALGESVAQRLYSDKPSIH